jgi:ComF family protein
MQITKNKFLSKKNYLRKIYAWLLPYTCILCSHPSQRHQDLCEPCYQTLPLLKQGCICCAIPLPDSIAGLRCGQCLQKTPPFDVTHALYSYELPMTKLILELKFNQALAHAKILGEHLAHAILQSWYQTKPLPKIIIPMPLHASRLKERGFNQALEIARPIAQALKLPLNTTHCQRNKSTTPQAMLSATQRQKNVKGAFTVTGNFIGQHIAVIDDVITTGNTITEFCKALKQHGAKQIDVWCCSRAC